MIARAIALLVALGALLGLLAWTAQAIDQRGYDRAAGEYRAAIEKTQNQAAQRLAQETARVAALDAALRDRVDEQNRKDKDHAKTVTALTGRLAAYTGPGMRLRDPHATGCGGGGGGAGAQGAAAAPGGEGSPAETSGLLSVPLTELLGRIVREADELNTAYASCRADAFALRGQALSP